MKKIIIGTRGSALALKQTDIVAAALTAADPSVAVEVRIIATQGDRDKTTPIPLDTVGKGWFTEEIEHELQDGTIDLAVHSLKDMAEEMPADLMIGAYLAREDARDALITKHGEPLGALPRGAVIGTDSTRRQVQMLALRPDARMKSLRGNVPNRIEKLFNEPYDAIILAVAGLKRLGLDGKITRYFEPDEMTPAPGQGILAVQARIGDAAARELLALVNDADAARAAIIERSFARAAGGGCKSPVGAYAWRDGNECRLVGMIGNAEILRDEARAPWDKSDELGALLAKKLLARLHA